MQENKLNNSLVSVNNFDFKAEHNGVQCIASLNPNEIGTENQYWFTAKMLCEIFGVADRTLRDNIESLINEEELGLCGNPQRRTSIKDASGVPHSVMLYNLEVLNKLGMCCFRGNKKAKEIRNKFNDVIVKEETSIQANENTTPARKLPRTYVESLRMLADEIEAHEKEIEAHGQTKIALKAEQEQHQKDNKDFCEYVDVLNQKKAEIGTRREATAMNTASQKSKECNRLTEENTKLTTENNNLKDEIGRGCNWKQVTAIEWLDEFFTKKRDANFYSQCGRILTQISKEMGIEVGFVPDTKYRKNCYYIAVVDEFRNRLNDGCEYSRIKQYYKTKNMQSTMSLFDYI